MTRPRLLVALVLSAGAVILMPAGQAAAHVEPVSISPAHGARLEEPPAAVVVTFDDELDFDRSVLELLDEHGEVVAQGALDLEVLDHRTMRLTVPAGLPDGAFAIRWHVLGIADGHPVAGEAGFAVGAADPTGALTGVAETDRAGEISVTPWLVAFAVAAAFVLIAALQRRRQDSASQLSARGP